VARTSTHLRHLRLPSALCATKVSTAPARDSHIARRGSAHHLASTSARKVRSARERASRMHGMHGIHSTAPPHSQINSPGRPRKRRPRKRLPSPTGSRSTACGRRTPWMARATTTAMASTSPRSSSRASACTSTSAAMARFVRPPFGGYQPEGCLESLARNARSTTGLKRVRPAGQGSRRRVCLPRSVVCQVD